MLLSTVICFLLPYFVCVHSYVFSTVQKCLFVPNANTYRTVKETDSRSVINTVNSNENGVSRRDSNRKINYIKLSMSEECDVVVIGAGIGGLSAASILSAKYGMNVKVLEAHYHAGGCAHSFPIKSKISKATYQFDAGPTIILGCSSKPYSPLRQVLNYVGAGNSIDWIPYHSWGMYAPETGHWKFELGPNKFETGPLKRFGGANAVEEFKRLREVCQPLCAGAAEIPTIALRGDKWKLLPLLKHFGALQKVIPYSDTLDSNFERILTNNVKDPWLYNWIDALAFSLSGLPAKETGTAALAYTLFDLHREGAALDYPRGGMGKIAEVFSDVIRATGSEVRLRTAVESVLVDNGRAVGVTLKDGSSVKAKRAVICNANIWSLPSLLKHAADNNRLTTEQHKFLFAEAESKSKTKSFLHLHLGIDSTGLDLKKLQPHYTIMNKGIYVPPSSSSPGSLLDNTVDPCGDRNMVAVSNPSVLDSSLVDQDHKFLLHAYGAGNEPYEDWKSFKRSDQDYKNKKLRDSSFLYESVAKALQIDVQEVKERCEVELVGTPLTHERYLRRSEGTYGAGWGSMLEGPVSPLPGFYLAGDSIFPGIGVPAVCVSGANAANTVVNVVQHIYELMKEG